MNSTEGIAKIVDATYKNIIEEFGPSSKQLVTAGRNYLKTLHATIAASRQYNETLTKLATLARNSTLKGANDIGNSLFHIVDMNKEMYIQQLSIVKSLEYDFLEPMEILSEKDTKLLGKEQKRFQQLYKGRREAYMKCMTTLKKTRRKKSLNTDKQLTQMKMLDSAKEKLELFCNDSLKEAVTAERGMYGTVLERQCVFNAQLLIYHNKGCEVLNDALPQWEEVGKIKDKLPEPCYVAIQNSQQLASPEMDTLYSFDSMLDSVIRTNSIPNSYGKKDADSYLSHTLRSYAKDETIYAKPIPRAKSEYNLAMNSSPSPANDAFTKRYSRIIDYDRDISNYGRALYDFEPTENQHIALREGDIVEYNKNESEKGWQLGKNLNSGRRGWFPIAFTQQIQDPAPYLLGEEYPEMRTPPPPPPPEVNGRSSSNSPQNPSGEYATLTRSRKLLPVRPPSLVSTAFNGDDREYTENGTLKAKQYASHPDISDGTWPRSNGDAYYHHTQNLPSMRL